MRFSSRDIFFRSRVEIRQSHDLLRNISLRVFIMSVPSTFFINSFGSFCLLLINSSATDFKCFWPFNCKKLPSAKPKLNSAIDLCGLNYSLLRLCLHEISVIQFHLDQIHSGGMGHPELCWVYMGTLPPGTVQFAKALFTRDQSSSLPFGSDPL